MTNDDDDDIESAPDTIALSDADAEAVAELRHLRRERHDIEAREKTLRDDILQMVGDADRAITGSGEHLLRVKRSTRRGVNAKALEAKYPEVYEEVMSESEIVTLDLS